MKKNIVVLIKGAGEMASGVAWRLFNSKFKLIMTELQKPLAVRPAVSFCEAVYDNQKVVEGVEAVLIKQLSKITGIWNSDKIPIIVAPEMTFQNKINPNVIIEATVSKRNTGINIKDAPLVIALGPGYKAGSDAHFVVETNRGHHLGRLIMDGYATSNTGVPGEIAGRTWQRVLRATDNGIFETTLSIGDRVNSCQEIASVNNDPIITETSGILRGLIRTGTEVKKGLKVGDIDPRGVPDYVDTISEKARAIGGSVLEAILRVYN